MGLKELMVRIRDQSRSASTFSIVATKALVLQAILLALEGILI